MFVLRFLADNASPQYICQRGSTCSNDAFVFLFASMYAFPTIALIGLGLNRVVHLVTSIIFFIVALVLFYGDPHTKIASSSGARNMVLCERHT